MNPLQQYPEVRQWTYRVIWIATGLLGAAQAFYAAMPELSAPAGLTGALVVLAYVSGFTNYTADQNVYQPKHDDDGRPLAFRPRDVDERGVFDTSIVVALACIVIIIAGLIFIIRAL